MRGGGGGPFFGRLVEGRLADGDGLGNTAVVTDEFLDFSASRGNDLRKIGLTGGCKWCLCTGRWKEAFDAREGEDDPVVPKWGFPLSLSISLLSISFALGRFTDG